MYKLRTDNCGEYVSKEYQSFCSENGILLQYTMPYNPEINSLTERMNRTLLNKARTILLESGLSKEFWGEAVYTSAYLINRSPTSVKEKITSELWEGKKPNVTNLSFWKYGI